MRRKGNGRQTAARRSWEVMVRDENPMGDGLRLSIRDREKRRSKKGLDDYGSV